METQKTKPFFNLGSGALEALNNLVETLDPSALFVLTDSHTETACLPILKSKWTAHIHPNHLTFKAGEAQKTLETCMQLWQQLTKLGADRNSVLINLGGGVTTDMGGFVAATFKRGMRFIQVPTSLLAMVDASTGGKTGVDFYGAKNQIGTFTEPTGVFVYPPFLETLPKSELKSGWAEVLKHGLIADRNYWAICQRGIENVLSDELIARSVEIKQSIVSQDLRESGLRKTLNFGHTLGHAIESFFLNINSPIKHGQAVAAGMLMASKLSSEHMGLSESEHEDICTTIFSSFDNVAFSEVDIPNILALLKHDKKNQGGTFQFVLLQEIAKPVLDVPVTEVQAAAVLHWYLKETSV